MGLADSVVRAGRAVAVVAARPFWVYRRGHPIPNGDTDAGRMLALAANGTAERTRRLEAMQRVSEALSGSLDVDAVAAIALETVLKTLGLQTGVLRHLDDATQELVLVAHRALPSDQVEFLRSHPRLKLGEELPGIVAQQGEPLVVADVTKDPRVRLESMRRSEHHCFVGVPLKARGAVVGVLSGMAHSTTAFTPADVQMMSNLGNMVGMAISNARLFQKVEAAKRDWEASFDAMSEGLSIISPDFRILRANRALAGLLGTTPQALVGQPCYQVLHGLDAPVAECPLPRCVEGKTPSSLERQESQVGNRWLHLSCDPLLDAQGEVEAVVEAVRDMTGEKQHEEAQRTRAIELETLANVSRLLVQEGSFLEKAARALEEICRIAGAYRVLLSVPEDHDAGLRVVATAGPGIEPHPPTSFRKYGEGIIGQAMTQGQPVIAADYPSHPQALPEVVSFGVRSALALPLKAGPRPAGVLYIDSRQPGHFTPGLVDLLTAIANGIGSALENARLQDLERRRSQELTVLLSVARALAQTGTFAERATRMLEELSKVTGAERVTMRMPEDKGLRLVAMSLGTRESPPPEYEAYSGTMTGSVFQRGQPLIVHDYQNHPLAAPHGSVAGLKSALFLPVLAGERVVATLALASQHSDILLPENINLVTAVADGIGILVDNARLQELERQNAQELAGVAERRTAVNRITRALSSSLRMEEIYETLSRELGRLLPFDRMTVGLLTPEKDAVTFLQPAEPSLQLPQRQDLSYSPLGQVMKTGQPRVTPELGEVRGYPSTTLLVEMGLHSAMSVPLAVRGQVLGTLNLFSREPGKYSGADLEMVSSVADQLAIALENAQLYRKIFSELEQSDRRLDALRQASAKLAFHEDRASTHQRLADVARDLVGARYCVFETGQPRMGASPRFVASGFHAVPLSPGSLNSHKHLRSLVEVAHSVRFADVPLQAAVLGFPPQPSVRGFLAVPVMSSPNVVGAFYLIGKEEAAEFSEDDERLAGLFAVLAGFLLENLDLYGQVAREGRTLAAIQRSMTEGLAVVDGEGKTLYCNEAAAAHFGLPQEGILGQCLAEYLGARATDFEPAVGVGPLLAAPAESLPMTHAITVLRPQRRDLAVTVFPIQPGPGERMTGLLSRDVTPERELERRRDTFVAVASHELRTPLSSILGYAELLLERNPPQETQREWQARILRESQRLAAIVDDLLNVSRIQSGKITVNLEDQPLGAVVDEVLTLVRPAADKHTFVVDPMAGLPDVRADRDKLTQVLRNLLDNAVKYSPQGGAVTVSARYETKSRRVVVAVCDQGIGIAPQDQARLFTTFHRIRRPETAAIRGTGLGLYLVKELVELMGGTIWLESELNKGSTFFFSLPCAEEG